MQKKVSVIYVIPEFYKNTIESIHLNTVFDVKLIDNFNKVYYGYLLNTTLDKYLELDQKLINDKDENNVEALQYLYEKCQDFCEDPWYLVLNELDLSIIE